MSSSIPERTVESWLAVELEVWFPGIRLWAPTQSAAGNWDLAVQGSGKLVIFECKGCDPLKAGHSVPINMPQLQRYAMDVDFAPVRDHVFYVLPAPPWTGPAPSPGGPFTPAAALPAAHADHRLAGPAGGCWQWFHVMPATALWASLIATGTKSINTRRLPNPPSLGLSPHPRGPVPATQRLGDFLDDVAKCRKVPLTGGGGPPQSIDPDDWRRPDGRDPGGPPIWPGDAEPAEPPDPPSHVELIYEDDDESSAPTPLAAFVPRQALASP